MVLPRYWLLEMIRWWMRAQDFRPVMDSVCRTSANKFVASKWVIIYDSYQMSHIWNSSKWIYCPNQKFKQYFECDKKTKSKVFADRICDGAPDCPGHQGLIQILKSGQRRMPDAGRWRTKRPAIPALDMIFEWIDENGTLGKCKTKNNKDGCCETMNMKLTKRMYDKSHNKFYNDIDKSRCSYEGKCSTVQYVRKWSFLESKGSRWS